MLILPLCKFCVKIKTSAAAGAQTFAIRKPAAQALSACACAVAHAPAAADIGELAQLNIDAIKDVRGKIISLCREPVTFEELLKRLFDAYDMQLSAQQYALVGSTVRSYLSSMCEAGSLAFRFEDNRMLWQADIM